MYINLDFPSLRGIEDMTCDQYLAISDKDPPFPGDPNLISDW